MPGHKWTPAQRAKFAATVAAKSSVKRSRTPRAPSVVYQLVHGRLKRLRLRTIKVYAPE